MAAEQSSHQTSVVGSDESSIVKIDDEFEGAGTFDRPRSVDPDEVTFQDVADAYIKGKDITCYFNLGDNVEMRNGDRIAIFKVPWCSIHDFICFHWAKEGNAELRLKSGHSQSRKEHKKIFAAEKLSVLLADEETYYQFCYVSEDGDIIGRSETFQIFVENKAMSSSMKTSIIEGCQDCAEMKRRISSLETVLAESTRDKAAAVINEAMADDLQKLRERVRELTDQEHCLKESLRKIHADYDSVEQAVGGSSDEPLLSKIAAFKVNKEEFDAVTDFVSRASKTGLASISEFPGIKNNPVVDYVKNKVAEVEVLQELIERKESELNVIKDELKFVRESSDELLKAMNDEMDAKVRVLERTVQNLQEQNKKNVEVIATVGVIHHNRRSNVDRYLRQLMESDAPEFQIVRDMHPKVMGYLLDEDDVAKVPAPKVLSIDTDTRDSVERSVSSQTSPVSEENAAERLVEKIVPAITSVVETAVKNAMTTSMMSVDSEPTPIANSSQVDVEAEVEKSDEPEEVKEEELEVQQAVDTTEESKDETVPEKEEEGEAAATAPIPEMTRRMEPPAQNCYPFPAPIPEMSRPHAAFMHGVAPEPVTVHPLHPTYGVYRPVLAPGFFPPNRPAVRPIPLHQNPFGGLLARPRNPVPWDHLRPSFPMTPPWEIGACPRGVARDPVMVRPLLRPSFGVYRPLLAPGCFRLNRPPVRPMLMNQRAPRAMQADAEQAARNAMDAVNQSAAAAMRATDEAVRNAAHATRQAAAAGVEAARVGAEIAAGLTRANVGQSEPDVPVFCPICNMAFPVGGQTTAAMDRHFEDEHCDFKCPICFLEFRREREAEFVSHVNDCVCVNEPEENEESERRSADDFSWIG